MKNKKPLPKAKAIVITGPGLLPKLSYRWHAMRAGLKQSEILFIGNGITRIDEKTLRKKIHGRIGPNTRFYLSMHGGYRWENQQKVHFIAMLKKTKEHDSEDTARVLKILQEEAGKQPIYVNADSCYVGLAKKEIDHLHPGSVLITETGNNPVYAVEGSKNLRRQFKQHVRAVNKDGFNPLSSILHSGKDLISSTLETVTVSYKRENGTIVEHTSGANAKLKTEKAYTKYIKNNRIPAYEEAFKDYTTFEKEKTTKEKKKKENLLKRYYRSIHPPSNSKKDRFERALANDLPDITKYYSENISKKNDLWRFFQPNEETFIQEAIKNGSTKILAQHLKYNPSTELNRQYKFYGVKHSPLQLAARNSDTAMVKLLLEHGAKPDYYNTKYISPLEWAIANGDIATATLLLDKVAGTSLTEEKKQFYPIKALLNNAPNMATFLLEHLPSKTPWQDKNGWTLLHLASNRGHIEVVNAFLNKYPKEVNTTNKDGVTPLHLAVRSNNFEIVQRLLKAGADPKLKDKDSKSALDYAKTEEMKNLLTPQPKQEKQQPVKKVLKKKVQTPPKRKIHVALKENATPNNQPTNGNELQKVSDQLKKKLPVSRRTRTKPKESWVNSQTDKAYWQGIQKQFNSTAFEL